MNTFNLKTTIHFGDDSLDRLLQIPYQKICIVTDSFIVKSGLIDLVTKRLDSVNKQWKIFNEVYPEAPLDKITIGVQAFLEYKPDAIIAIGGGSAIDSAKAIRDFGLRIDNYAKVALIVIPTTSGTGSEVTTFAVVNDKSTGRKFPLVYDELAPDEAILDASLVMNVPQNVTADTGMDVVTHAIEAYVSLDHNDFASALAEKSLEMCSEFLLRCYLQGPEDKHARQKMHVASCLAGIAFNDASLGISHSIAHQLGTKFHITHGRANAIVLPHVIEFNSNVSLKTKTTDADYLNTVTRYAQIAHFMGLSSANSIMGVKSLINWIQCMNKEMSIESKISDFKNIEAIDYFNEINNMVEGAMNDACTKTNPRTPTKEDLKMLFTKIW